MDAFRSCTFRRPFRQFKSFDFLRGWLFYVFYFFLVESKTLENICHAHTRLPPERRQFATERNIKSTEKTSAEREKTQSDKSIREKTSTTRCSRKPIDMARPSNVHAKYYKRGHYYYIYRFFLYKRLRYIQRTSDPFQSIQFPARKDKILATV